MLGLEASTLLCTENQRQCVAKQQTEHPTAATTSRRSCKRLECLLRAEDDYLPTPSFLKNVQSCVDVNMRARVVEMMHEGVVGSGEQATNSDVFQASCNLMDRVLSKKNISSEGELVACAGACVMISCKLRNGFYEDHHSLTSVFPCSLNILVAKEREICNCLKWNHHCVTSSDFIDELLLHLNFPHQYMNRIGHHANTLCDVAVSEYCLVGQPPSLIACSAICCTVENLLPDDLKHCRKVLTNLTGIEQDPLIQCQKNIDNCFETRVRQYKGEEALDSAGTPTEIGELFTMEHREALISETFLPVSGQVDSDQ